MIEQIKTPSEAIELFEMFVSEEAHGYMCTSELEFYGCSEDSKVIFESDEIMYVKTDDTIIVSIGKSHFVSVAGSSWKKWG